MLKLAEHILDSKAADFEPASFEDRYETALVDLLKNKRANVPVSDKVVPFNRPTASLMDALRRSIEAAKPRAKSITRRTGPARKRA